MRNVCEDVDDDDFVENDMSVKDGHTSSEAPSFPKINIRDSPKNITPMFLKELTILRYCGVSHSHKKAVPCLVNIGNSLFGQEWTLRHQKTTRKRILHHGDGDQDEVTHVVKKPKIGNMEAPCPNC